MRCLECGAVLETEAEMQDGACDAECTTVDIDEFHEAWMHG